MTNKKRKSKVFSFLRKKLGHELAVKFKKVYNEGHNLVPMHEDFNGHGFTPSAHSGPNLVALLNSHGIKTQSYNSRMGSIPDEAFLYYYTGQRASCECCCEYAEVYLTEKK